MWSRAEAKEYEHRLLDKSAGRYTIDDALDRWEAQYVPRLRSHKQIIEHMRALRAFTADKTLHEAVNAATALKLASTALAPATINQRLAVLRRVLSLAFKEWDWLHEDLARKVSLLPVHNERHVYLTRSQVEALAAACSNRDAKDLIVLAAFTGLRLSELFRARSTDVWQGCLRLDARTKNSRPRSIPLHPRALAIAQRLPLGITRVTLRQEWVRARRKCALEHVHFHDLRHTFASWCLAAGARLPELKELMGHQTIEMTMRYAHLTPNATRTIIEKIG